MGVGARSAAAAPFRLLQVLEVDLGEGRRLTRRISRSRFDEAKLWRFCQQAGSKRDPSFDLILAALHRAQTLVVFATHPLCAQDD